MHLTFDCPDCGAINRAELTDPPPLVNCPGCPRTARPRAGVIERGKLIRCALCATDDLYVQKDFPHRVGLSIVGLGILLSTIAWWRYQYPLALAVLLVTAALDLCLYYLVGDVTLCYRCLAQHRGAQRNPLHGPFDLGVGERYRQERLRLEMLRRAARGPGGADQSGSA